ncbi:hypothetical protein NUM3379_35150 [Kineococcus sp. NUM-3379]
MRPGVAGSRCANAPQDETSTAAAAAQALDELLFAPTTWFCIDSRNRRVPGATPGTLAQGLALVGNRVASVVGRLRDDVVGIDIDADGDLGDVAAESLRDWCRARGLFHLLRPSGGGRGHWHVYVLSGVFHDALLDFVCEVRHELHLTAKALDVREALRPLSAPHRRRRTTAADLLPAEVLADALRELRRSRELVALRESRTGQGRARDESPARRRVPGRTAAPLTPLARQRRPLPAPWAAYLREGRRAAAAGGIDRDPSTRSQIEVEATTQLVITGHSHAEAWTAIERSARTAFTKAKAQGLTWWTAYVWNRAVQGADAWLSTRRGQVERTVAPLPQTQQARKLLAALWLTWPARTRHVDREVFTVVLSRMDRLQATAAGIPQRDLLLDCAVASRTTVRASLKRLQASGLLAVDATYAPGTTSTSHTLRLPDPLPPMPEAAQDSPVAHWPTWVRPPLSGPTPSDPPQLPPPLRRALGLPAVHVLSELPRDRDSLGATEEDLARQAGLLEPGQTCPSAQQIRTARRHLRTLGEHGLAAVDEHGRWRATAAAASSLDALGHELDAQVRERVALERAEFRAVVDLEARRARWQEQRRAAQARAAKASRAAQRAWWNGLDPSDQQERAQHRATAFDRLPPEEQAARVATWARTRRLAGEVERDRHEAWRVSLSPEDVEARSFHRAVGFHVRPHHERVQLARSWALHRRRYQLPDPIRPDAPGTARCEMRVSGASSSIGDQQTVLDLWPGVTVDSLLTP